MDLTKPTNATAANVTTGGNEPQQQTPNLMPICGNMADTVRIAESQTTHGAVVREDFLWTMKINLILYLYII